MSQIVQQPILIVGKIHTDARGSVSFVNDFDFNGVDRFYWVRAAQDHAKRGWVGHRIEHKWFTVIHGEVTIAVVQPDNWTSPSRHLSVALYKLSASTPQVLHVPPGHATASIHLTSDAILMIFSSGKITDTKTDDFRFPIDTWHLPAAL